MSIEEAAENYAINQMECNKWLRELTDDEAIHLKNMLIEFAEQFKAQEQKPIDVKVICDESLRKLATKQPTQKPITDKETNL